jgi:predicted nucleic acid-binding protein
MNYILDTCILVEFARKKPEPKVIHWVDSVNHDSLFISVVTVGEMQRGIERLPDSKRKDELLKWFFNDLVERLKDHILPLDTLTLTLWGSLTSWKEGESQPMGVLESLIAATAMRNNMTVASRYVDIYHSCGALSVNPWVFNPADYYQ